MSRKYDNINLTIRPDQLKKLRERFAGGKLGVCHAIRIFIARGLAKLEEAEKENVRAIAEELTESNVPE